MAVQSKKQDREEFGGIQNNMRKVKDIVNCGAPVGIHRGLKNSVCQQQVREGVLSYGRRTE
jgi:hypothetical protein